jgi:hypothetical protein
LNDGSGIFSIGAAIGPSGTSTSIAAGLAELNGDLEPDLVIGGSNAQGGFYPGLGGGAFGARDSIPSFGNGATPDLGDMDDDGDVDLLGFGAAPGVRWWSNDGLGVFTLMDTVSSDPTRPEMVGDVDGDWRHGSQPVHRYVVQCAVEQQEQRSNLGHGHRGGFRRLFAARHALRFRRSGR